MLLIVGCSLNKVCSKKESSLDDNTYSFVNYFIAEHQVKTIDKEPIEFLLAPLIRNKKSKELHDFFLRIDKTCLDSIFTKEDIEFMREQLISNKNEKWDISKLRNGERLLIKQEGNISYFSFPLFNIKKDLLIFYMISKTSDSSFSYFFIYQKNIEHWKLINFYPVTNYNILHL